MSLHCIKHSLLQDTQIHTHTSFSFGGGVNLGGLGTLDYKTFSVCVYKDLCVNVHLFSVLSACFPLYKCVCGSLCICVSVCVCIVTSMASPRDECLNVCWPLAQKVGSMFGCRSIEACMLNNNHRSAINRGSQREARHTHTLTHRTSSMHKQMNWNGSIAS